MININLLVFESLNKKLTDKDILDSLKDVEYGAWDRKKKRRMPDTDFDKEDYLYKNNSIAHPDELLNRKVGHCYDQSLYQNYHLKKHGYTPKMIYMENPRQSHATSIYKDDKNKWHWMEHAWGKQKGIHGNFDNDKDAIDHVLKVWTQHNGKPTYYNPDVNIEKILKLKNINQKKWMKITGSKFLE